MEMKRSHQLVLLVSCWLCYTSFAAILRPYRETQKPRTTSRWDFQPTPRRCCNIGERVAKRKKICDITILAVFRKVQYERLKYSKAFLNRSDKHFPRARLSRLSEKVSKCSAVYPKRFVQCCNQKIDYYKLLKKCRLMPRRKRKRCKKMIHRKFG